MSCPIFSLNITSRGPVCLLLFCLFLLSASSCSVPYSLDREVGYRGGEALIYVAPGEPTQVVFPQKIKGGFERAASALTLERNANNFVVYAAPHLEPGGETLLIILEDNRSYSLRVLPAGRGEGRDRIVHIEDMRKRAAEPGAKKPHSEKWRMPIIRPDDSIKDLFI